MIKLRNRSYQQELMDADDISFAELKQTLKELNFINGWLGGHSISIKGVKKLASARKLTICEIGCGGGDNLGAVYRWSRKHGLEADFIGIDLKEDCIAFAKQQYPNLPCRWICSDYAIADFTDKRPDIIFSSLFCHHFTEEQLLFMLQWLKQNGKKGFFINDLHRHWLAYYLIKFLARLFSRSRLLKNDAPLSVARGFKKKEIIDLFQRAGIDNYTIKWKWAFRWLIIVKQK